MAQRKPKSRIRYVYGVDPWNRHDLHCTESTSSVVDSSMPGSPNSRRSAPDRRSNYDNVYQWCGGPVNTTLRPTHGGLSVISSIRRRVPDQQGAVAGSWWRELLARAAHDAYAKEAPSSATSAPTDGFTLIGAA